MLRATRGVPGGKDAFQVGAGDCRSKDAFQAGGGAGERRIKDALQVGERAGNCKRKDADAKDNSIERHAVVTTRRCDDTPL
jgi:hypothetical protein